MYDIGDHWFKDELMKIILSLSCIADKHKMTLDTSEEISFKVNFHRKIVNFKEASDRSWGLVPNDNYFLKSILWTRVIQTLDQKEIDLHLQQ